MCAAGSHIPERRSSLLILSTRRNMARSTQSLHARLGPSTTNGDGFGVRLVCGRRFTRVVQAVDPIWSDRNLREISAQIQSGLLFAHIRASMGILVQQTNCHPFRYGKWLWMHNGSIAGFQQVKRELVLAVDPNLYPFIEGSTNTRSSSFLP